MAAYNTYYGSTVTAPAIIASVLALVFVILVPLLFCLAQKPLRIFVEMLQFSLPDVDEDKKSTVEIDSKDITCTFYVLAVVMIPITIPTIFFSFWNVWLVEEEVTGACVPNFDCFPFMGDTMLQNSPVESCLPYSTSIESQNMTLAVL